MKNKPNEKKQLIRRSKSENVDSITAISESLQINNRSKLDKNQSTRFLEAVGSMFEVRGDYV